MLKIGILGGTFNPIHIAHLYMGQLALSEVGLDKVIFMPTGNPPHKDNVYVPAKTRLEMVNLAISDNEKFESSDFEVLRPELCYTYYTILHLKELYPTNELYFIVGEDSLDYLEKWHRAEELLKMCNFIAIGRGGFNSDYEKKIKYLKDEYGCNVIYIDAPQFDISSENIRRRIAQGKTVKYLVSDSVIEYINQNKLYI